MKATRLRAAIALPFLIAATGPAFAQTCDPNYAGSCVPNVWPADVDCAGGSGDGPYYTDGTQSFEVIGTDRYGLDTNDQDTLACEPPARR